MAQGDSAMRKKRAFTLIELLVVVAIIALLIAILLPSLGKARSQAKTTVCASNMHAMGQASLVYNNLYDQYMVPGYFVSDTSGSNASREESWETVFVHENIIPRPSPMAKNASTTVDATQYTRSSFYCPENLTGAWHRQASLSQSAWYDVNNPVYVDSWYWINSQSEQYSAVVTANYNSGLTPSMELYDASMNIRGYAPKFTNFSAHAPASIVLFYEGNSDNVRNAKPNTTDIRWLAPHNGGATTNIGFADGHASRIDYKLHNASDVSGKGKPIGGLPYGNPLEYPAANGLNWFTDQ
jgi:prepilin-type N-terminal cleavage/methylation domain-containing protein/prepilin-type processing-associated H-X9-DG protein